MRHIKVKQRDVTDCGAACLASVAAFHQLYLPVSRIRQYASTDKLGTNVLGIVRAAASIGFEAKGVKGNLQSLSTIPKPAIAHLILPNSLHHYVVVCRSTPKFVEVMDPGPGALRRYSPEEFGKMWSGVLVLLSPGPGFHKGKFKSSSASRFWQLIQPHRTTMMRALLGAFIYTLIGLSTSIYVQRIVDSVLVTGDAPLLDVLGALMTALLLIQISIGIAKSVLTLQTGQAIDMQLILGYYQHLLRLPQSFFDSMRVGEIISRINDAVKIRAFINDVTIHLAVNLFVVACSFGLMLFYDVRLALLMMIIAPLYAILYGITNVLNKKSERRLMERSAELESQLVESLHAMSTIKCFGMERNTSTKMEGRFMGLIYAVYQSGMNSIFTVHSAEFLTRLFTIILLWTGGRLVLERQITSGELLSFFALMGYFTGPLGSLIGLNKIMQNAFIASDRLFEIMDLEGEQEKSRTTMEATDVGDIRFSGVTFGYGTRALVFHDLDLHIEESLVTAVVGESGSGKSTLVSLLQKIYSPQSGTITIGKTNVRYADNESLRRMVGVVPQRIDLFVGSVLENITMGDEVPDLKKVAQVCSDLGLLEFIEELPAGFDSAIGENGATLSGGQRQRIAVARALYRDPQILILDEATSSLDAISEEYVLRVIRQFREAGKTVILIAHRLTTTLVADRIVVLGNGQVLEQGTHGQLMQKEGAYFSLWSRQIPASATAY